MGVRTLTGTADGTTPAAAMYDSRTGRMVGMIWEADDAEEQIEAFLEWLRRYPFVSFAEEIGLTPSDMPFLGTDGTDARHWGDRALGKLIVYWKSEVRGR